MTPDTPILMIGLQIPVLPDTTVDQVLATIAKKVSDAIAEIRQSQATSDPEPLSQEEFNAWVLKENTEAYTEASKDDLLNALGYSAEA